MGERGGWVTVRFGKGRKRRRVPIHLRARRVLNAYLEQEKLADPADRAAHAAEPLFRSRAGEPLTPYALWYTVKKYARLAEVEGVTPHTFRHSVATRLVRDPQVDMVTAATFLGHSRLDTTARYSWPSEDDLARAVGTGTGNLGHGEGCPSTAACLASQREDKAMDIPAYDHISVRTGVCRH